MFGDASIGCNHYGPRMVINRDTSDTLRMYHKELVRGQPGGYVQGISQPQPGQSQDSGVKVSPIPVPQKPEEIILAKT